MQDSQVPHAVVAEVQLLQAAVSQQNCGKAAAGIVRHIAVPQPGWRGQSCSPLLGFGRKAASPVVFQLQLCFPQLDTTVRALAPPGRGSVHCCRAPRAWLDQSPAYQVPIESDRADRFQMGEDWEEQVSRAITHAHQMGPGEARGTGEFEVQVGQVTLRSCYGLPPQGGSEIYRTQL